MALGMRGWKSSRGMNSRTRVIDEATAQAILNCKGKMNAATCIDHLENPKVTLSTVKSIWYRKRWTHLQQQFDPS